MRWKLLVAALLTVIAWQPVVFAAPSAQELVQSVSEQTLAKIKAEKDIIKANPDRIYDLVNEYVLPHFDFERMSRWVLGKYWRQADARQQSAFVQEFRTLLVRTYATSLSDYSDQSIEYLPFRDDETAEEVTVRSEVAQPGGFPIPINYNLHKRNGDWKVFDVTIDGISLIANYRTTFAREIRTDGIDALIKKLADRNEQARK